MHGGQAEFASALGTTRQEVSAWENGKREPNSQNLRRIATVLDVTITELTSFNPETAADNDEDMEYWRDLAKSYKKRIMVLEKEVIDLKKQLGLL